MAEQIELVVPIDYGSDRPRVNGGICLYLSKASVITIEAVLEFLVRNLKNNYAIAYCVADLPDKGMYAEDSRRWKGEIFDKAIKISLPRIVVPAKTSIDEAQNIKEALAAKDIQPRKIVIFCDRWHAMRLRVIWRHFFPTAELEFRTGRYVTGGDYAQMFLRSPVTWWLVNFVGLVAMKLFGIELLGSIKQP